MESHTWSRLICAEAEAVCATAAELTHDTVRLRRSAAQLRVARRRRRQKEQETRWDAHAVDDFDY